MRKYCTYFILFILFYFADSGMTENAGSIQDNRSREVIRIDAAQLVDLVGQNIESIQLYRYLSEVNIWEPIPYQIDIPSGFSYSSKESGVFEEGDQLLFLAKDLGDRATAIRWTDDAEAGNQKRICLGAVDPLTQDTGFIYIYLSQTLSGSDEYYLSYDETEDLVESADYLISHGKYGLQDSIVFKSTAGGDDIDFFDTQKLRFKIRIIIDLGIFGKIKKTFTITEETRNKTITVAGFPLEINLRNISTEYSCSGKIRLRRTTVFEIKVDGDGIGVHESSKIYLTTDFFPHYTEWRADEISIPEFDEGKIKMMRFSSDLNENSTGMMFYNLYNPSGVRIDGVTSHVDTTVEWDYNWHLIHADPGYGGSQLTTGSILSIMDLRGDPLGDEQELWFRDDAAEDNDDTGDERSYGDVGVLITGNSITGELSFLNRTYYIPETLSFSQAEEEIEKDEHQVDIYSQSQYPIHLTIDPPDGGVVRIVSVTDTSFGQREVTLVAGADSNYEFDYWSGDASGTSDTLEILMDGPKFITANFVRLREITVDTNPSGLEFRADGVSYSAPQSFIWREGSAHTLSIDSLIQYREDTRYIFSEWSSGETRDFDYIVPEYDEDVTGDFITEFKIFTSVNLEEAGSIALTPAGEWFEQGSQVECSAVPLEWYTFIRWEGDVNSEENPVTVSIDSSLDVKAVFGNYAPVVSLPDTFFTEDDTLTLSFETINKWVYDQNNPDSTLKVYFQEGKYITFHPDSSSGIINLFSRNSNWYGKDSLMIKVNDPLDETGQDYLCMEVHPINDAPQSFSLQKPADEAEITGCPDSIHFTWQQAIDPDPGDLVTYNFELDTTIKFNSPLLIKKDNITEELYNLTKLDSIYNFTYYWQVTAADTSGISTVCNDIFTLYLHTTSIHQTESLPDRFILEQNYPNPFNTHTIIRFGLPETEEVNVYIMNSRGQKVCTLVNNKIKAGYHTVNWNGKDEQGRIVSTGVYFIVCRSGESRLVRKALFLK